MNRSIRSGLLFLLLAGVVLSCSEKKPDQGGAQDSLAVDSMWKDSKKEKVNQFVHIFPSHLRVARIFKNGGLKYEAEYLLPTGQATKLLTAEDQALGLGFFGVDMAYTAINNQTQTSISYLKVSRDLSRQLGLESVYESNAYLDKFQKNINSMDSLEAIIRDLFSETDAFLKDNDKFDLTLLTFAGGWTESVYIAASYARKTHSQAIIEAIGDQMVSLGPLIQLLSELPEGSRPEKLLTQLREIQDILKAGIVKAETDTTPMVYQLTDAQLDQLITKVKEIRSKITNA